jgi:hypothetical protein
MRRIFALAAVAATLTAAAACGGNQDPTLDDASSGSSTTATSVVAGEAPPGSETTVAPVGETPPVAETVPVETVPDVVEVPAPPPGTPTYGPPEAGTYTYRVIAGQGAGQQTITTIERINDTDIRQTGAGFTGGQQVAELSFRGNEVHLTRLVVTIPIFGVKEFIGDVLFTPIPPAGNWSWSLTSTDNSVTVNQTATADAATNTVTSTLQALGQTITLVITYDLELRMPRRIQTTGGGQNNTSELVGFQPA